MPSIHNRKTPEGFTRKITPEGRIVFSADKRAAKIHKRFLDSLGKVSFPGQMNCITSHLKNESNFFWKVDLKDAFDFVTELDIELALDISFGVYGRYFFHPSNGGLIQGAPASHILFNLYCEEVLDTLLKTYCKKYFLVYTRYVDDLLFSDKERIGRRRRKGALAIIRKSGNFQISEQKTVLIDNKKVPLIYLGVKILRGHVSPTQEFVEKLRQERENPTSREILTGLEGWNRTVLAGNKKIG